MLWSSTSWAVPTGPQVEVIDPWVRATVAGQPVAGAFMELKSPQAARLVGATTPAAKRVELHEMKHEGGVMKMRGRKEIALPAGEGVRLEPGGLHIMMFGLQKPLEAGQTVTFTLQFRGSDGKPFTQTVEAPVRPKETSGQEPAGKNNSGHEHH